MALQKTFQITGVLKNNVLKLFSAVRYKSNNTNFTENDEAGSYTDSDQESVKPENPKQVATRERRDQEERMAELKEYERNLLANSPYKRECRFRNLQPNAQPPFLQPEKSSKTPEFPEKKTDASKYEANLNLEPLRLFPKHVETDKEKAEYTCDECKVRIKHIFPHLKKLAEIEYELKKKANAATKGSVSQSKYKGPKFGNQEREYCTSPRKERGLIDEWRQLLERLRSAYNRLSQTNQKQKVPIKEERKKFVNIVMDENAPYPSYCEVKLFIQDEIWAQENCHLYKITKEGLNQKKITLYGSNITKRNYSTKKTDTKDNSTTKKKDDIIKPPDRISSNSDISKPKSESSENKRIPCPYPSYSEILKERHRKKFDKYKDNPYKDILKSITDKKPYSTFTGIPVFQPMLKSGENPHTYTPYNYQKKIENPNKLSTSRKCDRSEVRYLDTNNNLIASTGNNIDQCYLSNEFLLRKEEKWNGNNNEKKDGSKCKDKKITLIKNDTPTSIEVIEMPEEEPEKIVINIQDVKIEINRKKKNKPFKLRY